MVRTLSTIDIMTINQTIRHVLGEFSYMFAQEDICSGRFNGTAIHQPFERKKHAFL